MTKICTRSKQYFDFANPEAYQFSVEEIASVLDSVARWSGHTASRYSVLHHSLCVHAEVEARLSASELMHSHEGRARILLQALFHDAAEAYVGDIPTPLKRCLRFCSDAGHNEPMEVVEQRILRALSRSLFPGCKLDLVNLHPFVVEADAAMLKFEAKSLMSIDPEKAWSQKLPEPQATKHLDLGKDAVRTFKLTVQPLRQTLLEAAARSHQEVLDLGRA